MNPLGGLCSLKLWRLATLSGSLRLFCAVRPSKRPWDVRLGCGYSTTLLALPINLSLPVEVVLDILADLSFLNTFPSPSPLVVPMPDDPPIAVGNSLVESSIILLSLVSLAPVPILDMLLVGSVPRLRTPPVPLVLPVEEEEPEVMPVEVVGGSGPTVVVVPVVVMLSSIVGDGE